MPPKPCPLRLERLIKRENAGNEPPLLRQILKAFQDKRQNKGPDTFAVKTSVTVTVNLVDCKVTTRNELALALGEIDLASLVELIGECGDCGDLFWIGRTDKKACDKHVERWRKRENRRDQKGKKTEVKAQKDAAKLEKTVRGLSKTATAVIIAIMARHCRLFHNIDQEACYEVGQISWERVPSSFIVRQTLTMLVRRGYLEHRAAGNPLEDRYEPEDKLFELWAAVQRARSIAT